MLLQRLKGISAFWMPFGAVLSSGYLCIMFISFTQLFLWILLILWCLALKKSIISLSSVLSQVTHLRRSRRSATKSPEHLPTRRTLPVCWTRVRNAWRPVSAWTAPAKASARAPVTSAIWARGRRKDDSSRSRSCCRSPRLLPSMSWCPTMKPTRFVQYWSYNVGMTNTWRHQFLINTIISFHRTFKTGACIFYQPPEMDYLIFQVND